MTRTAVKTIQAAADCLFSRPGYRLTGVSEADQPEPIWVCTRDGERRPITEEDCADCPRWQKEEVTPCP